jgi:uncharacterized protein with HEPN domain
MPAGGTVRPGLSYTRDFLIGFRIVLVHGYAGLNSARVWRVLHENLPEVREAVTGLPEEIGCRDAT